MTFDAHTYSSASENTSTMSTDNTLDEDEALTNINSNGGQDGCSLNSEGKKRCITWSPILKSIRHFRQTDCPRLAAHTPTISKEEEEEILLRNPQDLFSQECERMSLDNSPCNSPMNNHIDSGGHLRGMSFDAHEDEILHNLNTNETIDTEISSFYSKIKSPRYIPRQNDNKFMSLASSGYSDHKSSFSDDEDEVRQFENDLKSSFFDKGTH